MNIKDEILEEKKKMENIKTENNTLLSIYKTRIKNSEQTEIELSIKNTEEMKRNQLTDLKKEIKVKEIKFKELEYKLKEQRNNYSNLMTMINTIKNKITEAKFLKYENNDIKKVNYDEEIEKEQKAIEEEEKKLALIIFIWFIIIINIIIHIFIFRCIFICYIRFRLWHFFIFFFLIKIFFIYCLILEVYLALNIGPCKF